MDILNQYLYKILLMILLMAAAYIGRQARRARDKYINTEIKQVVCRNAVRFVEQVYRELHGPEKLRAAMTRASEILFEEYGIQISDTELITMIEAAVNEFNDAFGIGSWTSTDPQEQAEE